MKRKLLKTVAMLLVLALIFSISSFMFIAGAETASSEVPEGYTPVYTEEDLNNIRNDLAGKYILMDDIDLFGNHNWKPIGTSEAPFTGELEGNGKCILNMMIYGDCTYEDSLYFGLFGSMENSTVKNLSIINVNIDVEYTSDAVFSFRAGAIAGYANTTTIENCFVSGKIVLDGFNKGAVGGFVGKINNSRPINCFNYADITINSDSIYEISVGGIAGTATYGNMTQCGNSGNIKIYGTDSDVESRILRVGGIQGDCNRDRNAISDCYNIGNIKLDSSTPSTYVGGISGESYIIRRSYNIGTIDVPENFKGYAGGIAGGYASGGLAVVPAPAIENVYYSYLLRAVGTAPDDDDFENAKLLTEDEFKKQESFVGFNFETAWKMEENGYPVLRSMPETPQGAIASGKCGDDVNYEFNYLTGEIRIFGTGEMDNYQNLTLYPRAPWIYETEFVKSVVIEDGVTSIGDDAFYSCEKLEKVTIASSVKRIGTAAFIYCVSLDHIDIPDGVETIDDGAFWQCEGLKTVSIPKSVLSLKNNSFYYCSSLEALAVDDENPNYSSDEYGVLFDKNKTVLIRYPSGSAYTKYTVPKSVTEIDHYSFTHSENLKNIVFPDRLKQIGTEAFMFSNNLVQLSFPDSLDTLCAFSFHGCAGLESVTIPEGTKIIGSNAFSYCYALETINLPDSLERIETDAFARTAFFENEANWENGVLYCGKYLLGVKEDFKGKLVIKNGTRMIADFAVNRCKTLTEVTMPDSLIIIGEGAFNMCDALQNVIIPASVTTLIGSTFRFCDSLVSVTVPETVTVMGNQVFYDCENLESVEIKAKVSTIGRSMFYDCPKLTSVKLPDTVKTIDEAAFRECDSLETIVLPEGLEVIAEEGFAWSPKFTNINLPESLVTIGERAFYGTNINSIVISKNVTTIGKCAFAYTSNSKNFEVDAENTAFMTDGRALYSKDGTRLLYYFADDEKANYIIPDGVTTIDDYAFAGRENIERVTIPASVTEASGALFRKCNNLKSVAIVGQIETIGSYCFGECTSLEKVYISSSVERIIFRAFYGCTNLNDIYFGGTEEDWNKFNNIKDDSVIANATVHYNHVHSHSLDAESDEIYAKHGYRLYSCVCGHYYAEYDLVSKSDKYDVSAIYAPDCFDEEITLDVEAVTGDREPGGIYMVDGKTYVQVGVYNLKAVNANGETVQPNEGHTVKIKIAIPDEYKDKTDMVIYHRFVDGGREKLSTSDGTLVIQNGYMIFEVSKFSKFEILAGTAEMTVSKLPNKLSYRYKGTLDLSGIQLKITDIDGSVEYVTDTSKMTVEGFDSSKIGVQTVTVRYEQYFCTFEVSVNYTWWQWIIRILFLGILWY